MKYATLNNGIQMPMLGFGVYQLEDSAECISTIKLALAAGYRSIDTASIYRNEVPVGKALKESGIPRADIFLTTKVWNDAQKAGNEMAALDKSLAALDTEYVDLYLIHWPCKGHYQDSWLNMERIYKSGKARAVGVSNFHTHHLDDIKKTWSVVPAVNQFEMHPRLAQQPLIAYCKAQGIVPQSWGPLGGSKSGDFREGLLQNETLTTIAAKYNKTTAQIILRWNIELGVIAIPKSTNPTRIRENIDIFDFELTQDEVLAISALNKDERLGPDPDSYPFQ
ncbi:MAG: aldo/keto reductase [Defluviitaleaceae bacterium]|nr:aldo/keto reductase [Defluviitaleaceae bacterium]